MKKYLFILFIILSPIILFAQRGYYSIDSTFHTGIKLIDGGNSNFKIIQIRKGEKKIQYSPYQIISYGFDDKRFYKAFPIKISGGQERYFFQLLVRGKVNLYYAFIEGEKKYFLSDRIHLNPIEIPQILNNNKAFVDSLLVDCPAALKNIPYVRTRKNDLIRYIKDYNRCANRPFLRPRYGFSFGSTWYNLFAANTLRSYSIADNMHALNFSFNAFADISVGVISLSFHPELNFEASRASMAFNDGNDYDLVLNFNTISVPLYLRYTILKNKFSPFFQVGPVYSRNIRNESTLFQYQTSGNVVFTEISNSLVLQDDLAGFSIGTGVILNYGSKHSMFADFNYSKLYNFEQMYDLLNYNKFSFRIGIML